MPHGHYPPHTAYAQPPHPMQPHVKAEPVDSRYMLSNPNMPYGLPSLAGPQIPARPPIPGGQPLQYAHMSGRPPSATSQAPPPPTARYAPPSANAAQSQPPARIPQVDGPSSSESESPSPPPSQGYAPRSSHPSLPQPSQSTSLAKADDSEAINSDLDDSDSDVDQDGIEGGIADQDIVFCTYDKVSPHCPSTTVLYHSCSSTWLGRSS